MGNNYNNKPNSIPKIFSLILALIIILIVFLYTPKTKVNQYDDYFTVSSLGFDVSCKYNEIEEIRFADIPSAVRTIGMGSAKASVGTFKNDLYGSFKMCVNNTFKKAIIIKHNNSYLVFNYNTLEETEILYNDLLLKANLD